MGYIELDYEPSKADIVCKYYVEPSLGISIEKACEDIAAESSIGTWTDLTTLDKKTAERLHARVFEIDETTSEAKIAYPLDLFELGNMPEILSSIAGNIFGMKALNNLRLLDISFPKKMMLSFRGPRFGIPGIRELLKVPERPLVGTIIKPKVGLGYKKHAEVAYEAWVGGVDIVKDDENLTSQTFNPFKERVIETLRMLNRAEEETGERKVYMPNVTAETMEMLKRAEFVLKNGGRYAMVDILTCGFSGLQTLRNADLGLVLHAHRAGHAMLTRNKKHGVTMLTLAKIARLIGIDQLHIGAIVGKMEGSKDEIIDIKNGIEETSVSKHGSVLSQDWYGIKPVFAVCSGGLHPGHIPSLVNYLGKDIIIQAGGGVHGHPDGTQKGAIAMRQAVEAVMQGLSLQEYARDHGELKTALKKWV
jgi:ribulose-bisphosphate carboxylase large chain